MKLATVGSDSLEIMENFDQKGIADLLKTAADKSEEVRELAELGASTSASLPGKPGSTWASQVTESHESEQYFDTAVGLLLAETDSGGDEDNHLIAEAEKEIKVELDTATGVIRDKATKILQDNYMQDEEAEFQVPEVFHLDNLNKKISDVLPGILEWIAEYTGYVFQVQMEKSSGRKKGRAVIRCTESPDDLEEEEMGDEEEPKTSKGSESRQEPMKQQEPKAPETQATTPNEPEITPTRLDLTTFNVFKAFDTGVKIPKRDNPKKKLLYTSSSTGFSHHSIQRAIGSNPDITIVEVLKKVLQQIGEYKVVNAFYDVKRAEW